MLAAFAVQYWQWEIYPQTGMALRNLSLSTVLVSSRPQVGLGNPLVAGGWARTSAASTLQRCSSSLFSARLLLEAMHHEVGDGVLNDLVSRH